MGKTQLTGNLTNAISQDASNNVGIGGSPSGSYKLEVTGTAKVSSTLLVSGAATFSGFVGINGSPATAFPLEAYINSSTAYSSTSRGNVMRVYNSNTGANIFAGIELGGAGTANDGLAGLNAVVTGSGSAALTFYTRDSNTFAEKMRITSAGNVGIGTSSPTGKLDVASRGITVGSMPAGSVIQVVSFTYSTGFSTGSNSDTDTGLTLSITPTSSTSKILVIITAYVRATVGSGNCYIYSKVFRGASALTSGYAAMGNFNSSDIRGVDAINYLDSPATTSATTYKYTLNSQFASTVYMNSTTTPSTITLMEIAQ